MLRILFVGEFPEDAEGQRALEEFAECLGKAIIDSDHAVLTPHFRFDHLLITS